MRECTCFGAGTCYSCQHLPMPEKLPLGYQRWAPFRKCHPNARLGVDKTTGAQLGGCQNCWSITTWRWHCSLCRYRTAWVEDNVASAAERRTFWGHAA